MAATLTASQERAMASFVNTRRNMFIFGDGGTGKSYLHSKMRAHEDEKGRVHVTVAATGSAAHLIGGQTIASLFLKAPGITSPRGWYSSKEELFRALLSPEAGRPYFYLEGVPCSWLQLNTIFIDEISLPDAGMLELINHRLQMSRRIRLPFGGVRVVVFGDFGQVSGSRPFRYRVLLYDSLVSVPAPDPAAPRQRKIRVDRSVRVRELLRHRPP
jgi:ATP-dependent DNA helicase PIF1